MQLLGYKFLKDIQMKLCQQKIVERVLRVLIAEILNETTKALVSIFFY